MKYRVGLGKDSHRFISDDEAGKLNQESNTPLILGGVHVTDHPSFIAHSDGDVVFHAVFNSVASALGMKSIGYYFPDTSEEERSRNSADYLTFLAAQLQETNSRLENLSIVIECKTPKIDPISDEMKGRLSELLSVAPEDISITATTGEELSPWGKGLGVEVTVSALVSQMSA